MHLVVSSKRSRSPRLQALARRLVALGDQERHDVAVRLEERIHVDHEVLQHGEALDGLDRDRFSGLIP